MSGFPLFFAGMCSGFLMFLAIYAWSMRGDS